jgi:hypothetical protein
LFYLKKCAVKVHVRALIIDPIPVVLVVEELEVERVEMVAAGVVFF